jgi:hypothetical protein
MYVSGLGQITAGYNPCGPGYAFLNFQCVHDPNCDFSGGSGFGICPPHYKPPAIGTFDHPATDADFQAILAAELAAAAAYVEPELRAPVPPAPGAATPPVAPAAPAPAPAATVATPGIPTWAFLLAGAGVALWLWSGR